HHRMAVPLSRELRARFGRRAVPVRKGDTVRVLAGSFVGREERVARINRRDYAVTLDNVTLKMADEKLKPLEIRPGHLVITRLNLSDPWRRRSLKVTEEEVTPEERGESVETEETVSEAPALPEAIATPEAPATEEPKPEAAETESPPKHPRRRRSARAEDAEEKDA
ncbi:MAG: 50S ribosomal protein L24, partial [Thermoplasmata archaeon]